MIGVAAAEPRISELRSALAKRATIARAVHPVPIDAAGRVEAGSGDGVQVLWRPGGTSSEWLLGAVENLPDLRWIHSDSVGADPLPLAELAARNLLVTKGVGIYSRPMAEWVMLSLLAASKRFADFARQSADGTWHEGIQLSELAGKVVLLLGLGSVNTLVAEMLQPFHANVRAVTRNDRPNLPPGVTRAVSNTGWQSELPEADFVVLGLPLTQATRHMVGATAFELMKPGCWLVNVARGGLVDELALVAALDSGRLGGAVLDAFETEPLPVGHSLWGRENVVVVPHFTWSSHDVPRRRTELFLEQLAAWVSGRPLCHVVDLVSGY